MKALQADKQYLLTRLQTAEMQTSRAEYELHYLRSFLLDRVRPKSDRRKSRKRPRQDEAEPEVAPELPTPLETVGQANLPEQQLVPGEMPIPAGKQSKGPSEVSDAATLQLDSPGDVVMDDNAPQPEPVPSAEQNSVEERQPADQAPEEQPRASLDQVASRPHKGRRVTMGDAESEHLLLAASRLTRVSKRYNLPPPSPARALPYYSMAFPTYYPCGNGQYYQMPSPELQLQGPSSPQAMEEDWPEPSSRVLRSSRARAAGPRETPEPSAETPMAGNSLYAAGNPRKIGRPRGSPNKTKLIPLNETAASQRRMKALENAMTGKGRQSRSEEAEAGSAGFVGASGAEVASNDLGNATLDSQGSGLDLLLAARDMREPSAVPLAAGSLQNANGARGQNQASRIAVNGQRAGTQEYPEDEEEDYYYEDDEEEDQPLASTSRAVAGPSSSGQAGPSAGAVQRNLSALDVLADQAFGQNLDASNTAASNTFSVLGTSQPYGLNNPFPAMPAPAVGYTNGGYTQLTIPEQLARGVDATHHLIDPKDLKKGMTPAAALAKKARSPYLKWTAEEDEKLVLGVAEHGTRWDEVALQLPTRSYHQCRQRWLRGLRCESRWMFVENRADEPHCSGRCSASTSAASGNQDLDSCRSSRSSKGE